MKTTLLALSVLACAAAAPTAATAGGAAVCVSFAPSGYCDGMQYDSKKKATWHNYDCAGSMSKQTTALYKGKAASTTCDGATGCDPSATYGWDSLDWAFNVKKSTGTLTGVYQGQTQVLQQDIPVTITAGACAFSGTHGGSSSLVR